jgi:hypothetical protein
MTTSSTKLESRRVHELAREYTRRGFEVEVHPDRKSVPAFFGAYIPDLVAHRGDEHIAIEVKSRETLSSSKQLASIAKKLESHPGWRLELVVTNSTTSENNDRWSLDPYSAKRRLGEARNLLSKNFLEAAVLVGWSAAEAILRTKAEIEQIAIKDSQPRHLIKTLFSRGLLNKKDFQEFDRTFMERSHIAHGFEASKLSKKTVESFLNAVTRLIGTIE